MTTCGELMGRELVTLPMTASALEVAQVMRERRLGFVPICDPTTGVLVGVVSDRDLVNEICASDRRASEVPLKEVMMAQPPFCLENSDLQSAEEAMIRYQTSRLVVVNVRREPVGVLGLSVVLRALRRFGGPGRSGSALTSRL